jgi:hypothetical protein
MSSASLLQAVEDFEKHFKRDHMKKIGDDTRTIGERIQCIKLALQRNCLEKAAKEAQRLSEDVLELD